MTLFLNRKSRVIFIFFILGIFLSLGFDPYNIPLISIISIGIFFLLNDYLHLNHSGNILLFFLSGLSFGFAFFLSSMYWVTNSVFIYPELFYFIPIPLIGLPLILSIFYGVMQLCNFLFWSQNISRIIYFSIFWTLFEIIRGSFFSGLPWNVIAYSWTWSISIMQSLSIFGIYGLCFFTCITSACFFSAYNNKKYFLSILISGSILMAILIYGHSRVINYEDKFNDSEEIRLISSNFDQNIKWSDESINKILSLGSKDKISIFPETSIGFTKDIPLNWIAGTVRKEDKKYYNSMQYSNNFYDKEKLVPFTEFLPFENIFRSIDIFKLIPKNFFSIGENKSLFNNNFLPSICYEGIFPLQTLSKITDDTLAIVNISNDAWFGNYAGPLQHLTHVRYRTIETGLPMIRSTNKGYSVLINPIGQITESIPRNELNFIEFKIPNRLNETIYSKFKDWPIILFIAFLLIILYIFKDKNLKESSKNE